MPPLWRPSAAAVLWLTASGALRAEEFFPIRDQNPLLRGFYLPLPVDRALWRGRSPFSDPARQQYAECGKQFP